MAHYILSEMAITCKKKIIEVPAYKMFITQHNFTMFIMLIIPNLWKYMPSTIILIIQKQTDEVLQYDFFVQDPKETVFLSKC